MSTEAAVVLGSGAFGLFLAMVIIVWRGGIDDPGPAPDDWAESNASLQWEERAREARVDLGLQSLRDTSSKWATTIAALLGVLASVAFVAGPDDLVESVGGVEADIAAWCILAAAGCAALATLLASLAEQGIPRYDKRFDGWTYKRLTELRARRSAVQLTASRLLAVLALTLVVIATGIAWLTALTGPETVSPQQAITESVDGPVCGVLTSDAGQLEVMVPGSAQSTELARGAQVTLVDFCP
jgi:hypothetical protein